MSKMYGKFFQSTFTGSMFGAGPSVFALWGYVIANCREGAIELNPAMLAAVLGDTEENVIRAIEFLCRPDPKSRTKTNDGRRLIPNGAFLYEVPNQPKYRALGTEEQRREYLRIKKRESRKRSTRVNPLRQQSVNSSQQLSTQSDAEAEAEAKANKETRVHVSPLATFKDDLWLNLQQILPNQEIQTNAGLWITRIKENRPALYEAFCDFKLSKSNIQNIPAWLTQRYQHFVFLSEQRKASQETENLRAKLRSA